MRCYLACGVLLSPTKKILKFRQMKPTNEGVELNLNRKDLLFIVF